MNPSDNYYELTEHEALAWVKTEISGWLDPSMPRRQYETVVKRELEAYARGEVVAPYNALIELMTKHRLHNFVLFDVGASSGYYSEVLKLANLDCYYMGMDFNPHYRKLARDRFNVDLVIGDAANNPAASGTMDVVLCSGVLIHSMNYLDVIRECFRVADKQVIFHRTPVISSEANRYYAKEAYGLPCIELHFSRAHILSRMMYAGYEFKFTYTDCVQIQRDPETGFAYETYLFERK